MEAHLDACDLWEVVEGVYEAPIIWDNSTIGQIKIQKERKGEKKVKSKNNLVCCRIIHYVDQKNVAQNIQLELRVFEAQVP